MGFVIIQERKHGGQPASAAALPSEENFLEKENLTGSSEKPKYTYRELITLSLIDKTCLTLSNIYNWICTFYPFYSASDEKWKNSIRHNLSLYPEFVKGEKTQDGAGHLWYLDQAFRSNYLQDRQERIRRKSEQSPGCVISSPRRSYRNPPRKYLPALNGRLRSLTMSV